MSSVHAANNKIPIELNWRSLSYKGDFSFLLLASPNTRAKMPNEINQVEYGSIKLMGVNNEAIENGKEAMKKWERAIEKAQRQKTVYGREKLIRKF